MNVKCIVHRYCSSTSNNLPSVLIPSLEVIEHQTISLVDFSSSNSDKEMNYPSGEQGDFLAEAQLAMNDVADGILAEKSL